MYLRDHYDFTGVLNAMQEEVEVIQYKDGDNEYFWAVAIGVARILRGP